MPWTRARSYNPRRRRSRKPRLRGGCRLNLRGSLWTLCWREMDSNFRFRAGRNRYPIGSAELSWGCSRGLNPKSASRISSASALISALRGSYGVFVTPSPSATACADATRLPDPGRRDRGTGAGKITPMRSVSRERGGTRFTTTMSPGLAPILSVSTVAHRVERKWLNGNDHEPCHTHRDPRLGFGMRRSVDYDQFRCTDPIVDPSRRAPARQRR